MAARRGGPARGPAAAHARQHRAALGDHPGRDEAWRGDHPHLDAARSAGPGRPDHPRADPARAHRIGARAEVPRGPRRVDTDRRRADDRGRHRSRPGERDPRRGARRPARARGVAGLRGLARGEQPVRRRRPDPGQRPAAAVLHLRDDGPAQAGSAHARLLPGRAPVHDVLDRAAARRRAPEHLLPRLGQARLEQRLRAVERGGDGADLRLRAVLRREPAPGAHRGAGDHVLCAADRMADADPIRPGRL